ncbi:hypothetical protein HNQ59_003121 [Chitinivorax tropicus]|uniref:Uncharacterized protein n=1 Tax=Chitinivorax tropicus TaxID=714531 RepID=A0A840MU28_9PROT|nr:hypothetical protein [Chitinivorax tropicus]MBB5019813.1 hypothetical protein [Chitinivorax tropicus]
MRIPPLPVVTQPQQSGLSVAATASVSPAAPTAPRTLPPLVFRPATAPIPPYHLPAKPRPERRAGQDRRQHCRRHQPLPVLLDPRRWGIAGNVADDQMILSIM